MTKAELEKKKDLARTLYMSGKEQTEIADMVGVSRVTISKWCTANGWKEARAAKTITRPELIKMLMQAAATILEKVNASGDLKLMDSLGDKLAKLTAAIDKLDKSQANVVAAIEVFTAFSKYLEFRAKTDPEITIELIKTVNRLQDGFLLESLNKGSLVCYGD
jgi:putative ATPase subunit of terminase (gpP-like)|nr:MAG TPA: large terminase [Caudoviricetes sp.]